MKSGKLVGEKAKGRASFDMYDCDRFFCVLPSPICLLTALADVFCLISRQHFFPQANWIIFPEEKEVGGPSRADVSR